MNSELISMLICPLCSGNLSYRIFEETDDRMIKSGVVWCLICNAWYPIESELLDLLTGNLVYKDDRKLFWQTYHHILKLMGLEPDEPQPINRNNGDEQKLQKDQQNHFDWYALNQKQTYSAYETLPIWLGVDRLAFDAWRKKIVPGSWLLDIGCAEGRSTFKLIDLEINIAGFDISKNLVLQAIKRYRKGLYKAKASFFTSEATSLPIKSEVFDYILIYGVLHHIPNLLSTCQEVVRILKPGGVYFGSENNHTIFRSIFDFLQRIYPIWFEKAGPEALISAKRLKELFDGEKVTVNTKTAVFIPPHIINFIGEKAGYYFLAITDKIGQKIPIINQHGGLITFIVQKGNGF